MSLDARLCGTLVFYGYPAGRSVLDPRRPSGITGPGGGAGSLTLRWVAASHQQPASAAALGRVAEPAAAVRLASRRFPLRQAAQADIRLASRTAEGELLLQA
jgi:hypothetical protein